MSSDLRRLPAALLFLGLLSVVGCGKQGNPEPPLRAVPAPTRDLEVRQQGPRIVLDLTYPKTTAAGMALEGLRAVEVWEAVQPPPREGRPQPLDPRTFTAASALKLRLEEGDVGTVIFGDRMVIALPLPDNAEAKPEARHYAVRTEGKSGDRSDLSNVVALVPKAPPAPPERVSATARADGIQVEWVAREGATGYNVYRRLSQERAHGQPVHTAGPDQTSWLDTGARFGRSYIYAVTAIGEREPLVESAITSEHEVVYQDRFAPPPPADLVALAEGGRVRLVWRTSDAADLAGYIVYRRGPEGDFRRVTAQPVTTPEYVDTDVRPGQTLSYRVTAVDQTGNESAPGGEVRAVVP